MRSTHPRLLRTTFALLAVAWLPASTAIVGGGDTSAFAQPVTPTPATTGTTTPTTATPGTTTPPPPVDAAPPPEVTPPDDVDDADALRREYLALRDELFASRARSSAVASQLFSTKISLRLGYTTGRFQGVSLATIRLDGATVYSDSDGKIASDDAVRFEGYVAPGRHVLVFAVEAQGKDDARFSTRSESTVVVDAIAGRDLVIVAKARDDGDIAFQWQRSQRGSYKLVLTVDVASRARPATATSAAKARRTDAVASTR